MPKNIYMIIICFIKYMLYKNTHDRTIFIFLNVIILLKIECANWDAASDAAPISPLLPYPTAALIFIFIYLIFSFIPLK